MNMCPPPIIDRPAPLFHIVFSSYSFITAIGLAEDSAVVLSASILVSPFMVRILINKTET